MHYWVHVIPASHRIDSQRSRSSNDRQNSCISCVGGMVASGGCEYPWRLWCGKESGWSCRFSSACFLYWLGMLVLHQLSRLGNWPEEIVEAIVFNSQTAQSQNHFFKTQRFRAWPDLCPAESGNSNPTKDRCLGGIKQDSRRGGDNYGRFGLGCKDGRRRQRDTAVIAAQAL